MKTKQEKEIYTKSVLKIIIDNDWWIEDFNILFDSIRRLYLYYLYLDQAQLVYERLGEEYSWDERLKKMPDFLNISRQLIELIDKTIIDKAGFDRRIIMSGSFYLQAESLKVNKLKFGSKGSVDLIGIGKIFEVIKDVIQNYVPNKETKTDIILKEKEIEEREQKILQLKIENLKNLGLDTDEILKILGFESTHLKNISRLINNNKIIDFEIDKISKH